MKNAVHFGAGNIGRGFIGEVLAANDFAIKFVDINETIIDALQERGAYTIELAAENQQRIEISHVDGINNVKNPEAVVEAIRHADIVTTAIGPNILPYIAELIAKGIQARRADDNKTPFDIIACENMIGGSDFLKEKVVPFLEQADLDYVDSYVGFPNAAVDRIVPIQSHEDPLFVSVEPFKEWVIDQTMLKNTEIDLSGVHYVANLEPYIERKLFSVNTGHATVAYSGKQKGYETIDEALKDESIETLLRNVLTETATLLIDKWNFKKEDMDQYRNTIVDRFKNPYISDIITRVGRTPIRKLGYDERFIRPLREAYERGLPHENLLKIVGLIFHYSDPTDEQSVELEEKVSTQPLLTVVKEITGVTNEALLDEIVKSINQ